MDSANISTSNFTCTIAQYRGALVHGSFPIAVCIILILSFIQRTKKERRSGGQHNICRDIFSLIYPIDLFDNHDRLPHCLAFGAASSLVLDLFLGDYQSYFFGWEIPGWGKILFGSIVTVEIAIDCFPFFACITCKSRLLAYGMGFLYLTAWLAMLILLSVGCEKSEDAQEQYSLILPQIPVLICIVLLMVYFLAMFITIFIQRRKGIELTKEERLFKTHEAIYVRNLFNKPKEVVYTGWRARVFKNYKPHPGFIYPTRVLMPCFVSVMGLYQVAFWIIPLGLTFINGSIGLVRNLVIGMYEPLNSTEALNNINGKLDQALNGLQVSWAIASALSIFLPIMYIPHILKNYRKHLMGMWAGKHKLPTNVELNSTQSIVGSLKYIGFQVAVFLTGYMFIQGILFLLLGGLTFMVLAFIWEFQAAFMEIFVELVIPSMIIGISVMQSQGLFVKLFFIQDKLNPTDDDKPLALQRRVWFLIYCYVTMFLNLLFGLILAVIRVAIGLIISIFLLPRIDRPIWVPGFGDKDLVYVMYVGNLLTENAHSNPILVMFCHLMEFDVLRPKRKRQKLKRQGSNLVREGLVNSPDPGYTDLENVEEPLPLMKYFRWHLAYTLIKNPSLIKLRKGSAILPDQEVVVSDGEIKVISQTPGKANGLDRHDSAQMLPHIMEVMKRQDQERKKNGAMMDSFVVVDPSLIALEEAPKHPEPQPSDAFDAAGQSTEQHPSLVAVSQSGPVLDLYNLTTNGEVGEGHHTVGLDSIA